MADLICPRVSTHLLIHSAGPALVSRRAGHPGFLFVLDNVIDLFTRVIPAGKALVAEGA